MEKRELILIPTIHHKSERVNQFEDETIKKADIAIDLYWKNITAYITSLTLDFSRVKVYQDAFRNVEGFDFGSVVDRFPKTPNLDLLKWLHFQGAKVLGTESPELIDKMKNLILRYLELTVEERVLVSAVQRRDVIQLNDERDVSVGDCVEKTLNPNESGILFMGFAHSVEDHIEDDIYVYTPREIFTGLEEFDFKSVGLGTFQDKFLK